MTVTVNGTAKKKAKSGFDVILGNPPFVNAIEGGISGATKFFVKVRFPKLGGTSDLSYYFLDISVDLIQSRGRIGLIHPRALLNAPPARELRRSMSGQIRPNLLYAPDRDDFFPGAAVFVCAAVLGPENECKVSKDVDPQTAKWHRGQVVDSNWWLAITRIVDGIEGDVAEGPTIAELFEVAASMTTGDAYDVLPHVIDAEVGEGLKLVTTGLIDPGECRWGKTACRYLKKDFRFPRVLESESLSKSLRKRLANARRPKIIVAGLSKIVECFVDRAGEHVGAVATFSIFHPQDDVDVLAQLATCLSSPAVAARFKAELGGNAMGGGNTTMKREFLESLALPVAWPSAGGGPL